MIDPSWVAALGIVLFCIGLWGAFTRKNTTVFFCKQSKVFPLVFLLVSPLVFPLVFDGFQESCYRTPM